MQLIGIYINKANDEIKKVLKQEWYPFCYCNSTKVFNDEFIQLKDTKDKIIYLKKNLNFEKKQRFTKKFYNYAIEKDNQNISLNAIVGKNGSGKSTLFEIFNLIINNFAKRIKDEFPEYNLQYKILPEKGFETELYYELNTEIYCIKTSNGTTYFSNAEYEDIFKAIKEDKSTKLTNLEKLSNHIFYTIHSNYSLYTGYPDWMRNLYHKNDGYFTPIVLVPYRSNGNIDHTRENKLAEKRVQTLSLLLYKENNNFIEDYIPYEITYQLKTKNFYKEHEEYLSNSSYKRISDYQSCINYKIGQLQENLRYNNIYNKANDIDILITDELYIKIRKIVYNFWNEYFKKEKNYIFKNYCKPYLKYKTIKAILNYESITKLLKTESDTELENSIKNDIILGQLWKEENLNYINLKIIMCKRFMEYSFAHLWNNSNDGKVNIKDTLIADTNIKAVNSYHEIFSYLLPDFFDTHFLYRKVNDSQSIELTQMSSGEQHLYNSLSYIVYHIKNAQSNKNGIKEGKIPYKYFNLIFDETELYFHPEYQRKFINNLIKLLNRCNLNIEGLNISLVTHSPFVLSDIPKDSILALEKGCLSELQNETLGANIYDLLENQFFMTSKIGEVSRQFIEKIIKDCESENPISKNNLKIYLKFIKSLGDEYLNSVLLHIISTKEKNSEIKKQIKHFNNKIKNLKLSKKEKNEKN